MEEPDVTETGWLGLMVTATAGLCVAVNEGLRLDMLATKCDDVDGGIESCWFLIVVTLSCIRGEDAVVARFMAVLAIGAGDNPGSKGTVDDVSLSYSETD